MRFLLRIIISIAIGAFLMKKHGLLEMLGVSFIILCALWLIF